MRKSFVILSLAVFLLGAVSCKFTVWAPSQLVNQIQPILPLSLANFGHTPYGKSLSGTLAVADPVDACGQVKHLSHDGFSIFMMAVLNRRCDPVQQALHAERAGAKMLIIVHDQVDGSDGKPINISNVELADNGMGHLVKIPTIIIEKRAGDTIMKFVKENSNLNVAVTAKFDILQQSYLVNYNLWMSSASRESRIFMKNFHKFHNLLGNRVRFTPRYVTLTCFACSDSHSFSEAHPNCLSGGRYCAPDHGPHGISDGREVLREDLRQACIQQQDTSGGSLYKYITEFENRKECKEFKDDKCSYSVMDSVGINAGGVRDCVKKSFEGDNELTADNKILRDSKALYQNSSVATYPTLQINGKTYHGNMWPATYVFEAICSSLFNPPEICDDYYQDLKQSSNHSGYWALLIVITIILVLFLLCMIIRYKSSLREEMMRHMESQVSTQVSQYYAMKGEAPKPAA